MLISFVRVANTTNLHRMKKKKWLLQIDWMNIGIVWQLESVFCTIYYIRTCSISTVIISIFNESMQIIQTHSLTCIHTYRDPNQVNEKLEESTTNDRNRKLHFYKFWSIFSFSDVLFLFIHCSSYHWRWGYFIHLFIWHFCIFIFTFCFLLHFRVRVSFCRFSEAQHSKESFQMTDHFTVWIFV